MAETGAAVGPRPAFVLGLLSESNIGDVIAEDVLGNMPAIERCALQLIALAVADTTQEQDAEALVWLPRAFGPDWVPTLAHCSNKDLVSAYDTLRMLEVPQRQLLAAELAQRVLQWTAADAAQQAAELTALVAVAGDGWNAEHCAALVAALAPVGTAPLWLLAWLRGTTSCSVRFRQAAVALALARVVTAHEEHVEDASSATAAVRALLKYPVEALPAVTATLEDVSVAQYAGLATGRVAAPPDSEPQQLVAMLFGHMAPTIGQRACAFAGGHWAHTDALLAASHAMQAGDRSDLARMAGFMGQLMWQPMTTRFVQRAAEWAYSVKYEGAGAMEYADVVEGVYLHATSRAAAGLEPDIPRIDRFLATMASKWSSAERYAFAHGLADKVARSLVDNDTKDTAAAALVPVYPVLRCAISAGFVPGGKHSLFSEFARAYFFPQWLCELAPPDHVWWELDFKRAAIMGSAGGLRYFQGLHLPGLTVIGNDGAAWGRRLACPRRGHASCWRAPALLLAWRGGTAGPCPVPLASQWLFALSFSRSFAAAEVYLVRARAQTGSQLRG